MNVIIDTSIAIISGLVSTIIGIVAIYLGYSILTYEPSKTKVVSTLVCSGKVIVFDQEYLYTEKGVSWRFPHGSYTPSQGEVCSVQGREVSK